jgi:hypothetical protein
MNERIKNLEVQCWDDIAPEWAENVHMVFNIEKFAELIVKECMSISSEAITNDNWPPHMIAKHFGVEE